MATVRCSLCPSPRKLLSATDREHFRRPQPTKVESCEAQPQWVHLQNTPTPKAQGALQKKEQKDSGSLL